MGHSEPTLGQRLMFAGCPMCWLLPVTNQKYARVSGDHVENYFSYDLA